MHFNCRLNGETGENGIPGVEGECGEDGPNGLPGLDGEFGEPGMPDKLLAFLFF